jgi:tRNA (guanine26-N2/guanine27-N2)-dimethyltransferase
VLIGYCTRQASKYDLALTPILIHSTDHYYRVYFGARKGSRRAYKSIEDLGYIWHDPETGNRGFSPEPIPELKYAGPLWTGNLFDNKFLKKLDLNVGEFGTIRRLTKMLALWLEEAEAPALFYEVNDLASRFKISPPKMEKVLNSLREEDYAATRTHFSPQGFRTDADIETLRKILVAIS